MLDGAGAVSPRPLELIRNQQVRGSSPRAGSNQIKQLQLQRIFRPPPRVRGGLRMAQITFLAIDSGRPPAVARQCVSRMAGPPRARFSTAVRGAPARALCASAVWGSGVYVLASC